MQRVKIAPVWLAVPILAGAVGLTGVVGCGPASTDQATSPPPADAGHVDDSAGSGQDHAMSGGGESAGAESAGAESSMEKMMAGLKELSPADYESAMEQHVCPVSGEMLGSMGAPQKVDVNGTSVWICCDGCRDKLLADPEKYLAALKKQDASSPSTE